MQHAPATSFSGPSAGNPQRGSTVANVSQPWNTNHGGTKNVSSNAMGGTMPLTNTVINNSINNNRVVTKQEAVAMVAESASRVHSPMAVISEQPTAPVVWCNPIVDGPNYQAPAWNGASAHSVPTTACTTVSPYSGHGEYIRHSHNGNVVCDSQGRPVTLERWLGTAPLRSDLLTRPGAGGRSLVYLSGEAVTRILNDTFGFDGWHMHIVNTDQTVCIQQEKDEKKRGGGASGAWHVAYLSHVRLIHRASGTVKEDVGAGDNVDRILPTAISNAIKSSITDALKRAARRFGDKLGNALDNKFTIQKAPVTIAEALDRFDQEQQVRCGISSNAQNTTKNIPCGPQSTATASRSNGGKASAGAAPPGAAGGVSYQKPPGFMVAAPPGAMAMPPPAAQWSPNHHAPSQSHSISALRAPNVTTLPPSLMGSSLVAQKEHANSAPSAATMHGPPHNGAARNTHPPSGPAHNANGPTPPQSFTAPHEGPPRTPLEALSISMPPNGTASHSGPRDTNDSQVPSRPMTSHGRRASHEVSTEVAKKQKVNPYHTSA